MQDDLRDLLAGAAVNAAFANRLWVGLAALALVTIIPSQPVPGSPGARQLPFSLGAVPEAWFFFLTTLLLAVLCIAFAAAQAQTLRIHNLAHSLLADPSPADTTSRTLRSRDLYDATVTPVLNRVAPLPQLLRGEWAPPALTRYAAKLRGLTAEAVADPLKRTTRNHDESARPSVTPAARYPAEARGGWGFHAHG